MAEPPIKILLIDDDPDFIRLTEERLSSSKDPSFEFESAVDLTAGLERLARCGIDCLLLDLRLKDSDGLTTLAKVHAKAKDVPVIVLTGEYGEELGPQALKAGAQDYLIKGSCDRNTLIRSIRYSIERKKQEESLRRAYNEIKQLLDLIPSLLIRVDPQEKILYWNDGAEKVFNIPWNGAYGKKLSECGIDWDYDILKKGITACQVKKRPLRLEDIPFTRPDGTKGVLGVTVNPIEELETKRLGILIFGADITERRRLEAELEHKTGNAP